MAIQRCYKQYVVHHIFPLFSPRTLPPVCDPKSPIQRSSMKKAQKLNNHVSFFLPPPHGCFPIKPFQDVFQENEGSKLRGRKMWACEIVHLTLVSNNGKS